MSIGEELRKARKDKGMSQSEVARRLNINRSTYLRYETEEVNIPFKRLLELKYILDINLDKII